jgi:hypothetical protein
MSGSTQYAELPVPTRGDAFAATLGYLFVLIFVLVAAGNLVYLRRIPIVTTLASFAWLFLVFWVVLTNVREEGGVRQYLINRMGIYAGHQFIRAEPFENAISISIGYLLFGQPLNYLKIPTSAISSIQWSSGQGTAMAGRDMNDWSIAIWYNHPNGPRRKPFPGVRDEELFLIGPSGQKEKVEAFGKQIVAFLTRTGVELTVGRDDREFNTASRWMASEQSGEPEPPITRVLKS